MFKDDFKFRLEYIKNGEKLNVSATDSTDFKVEFIKDDNSFKALLTVKGDNNNHSIDLVNAYIETKYLFEDNDKFFGNGYQSWTTTKEYTKNDMMKDAFPITKLPGIKDFVLLFGDYNFQKYYKEPGKVHSYSYTYVKRNGVIDLFGSLTERTGYTVFHVDMNGGTGVDNFVIQKDVDGVTLFENETYEIFNLINIKGEYDEVFDKYFEALNIKPPKINHLAGYTSWYNYYGKIYEEQIDRDIDGLARIEKGADIFQIDDGFQDYVGDWNENDKFAKGMRTLTDKIHGKGYLAGLWMAPFNATFKSKVAKEHPEWLIRKRGTNKKEIGVISWGGGYTLDIYQPGAREHIKSFFKRVLGDGKGQWNFDLVKLDFLYSECQTPRYNKSRGQIMCEAIDFLRECVGDKLFLGCGVPLFPAFGKVDACRISCDVAPTYLDKFYNKLTNNEVPSARCAMNNTIFRRHLNGRAFVNDPDVFYLRNNDLNDKYYNRQGKLVFTQEQKELLAEVNNMCGDVLFVSDNLGTFDDNQMALARKYFAKTNRKVIDANFVNNNQEIEIDYIEEDKKYRLTFGVYTGSRKVEELK